MSQSAVGFQRGDLGFLHKKRHTFACRFKVSFVVVAIYLFLLPWYLDEAHPLDL